MKETPVDCPVRQSSKLIPSETMKAWFAGFMDGEGCIIIIKEYQHNRPHTSYYIHITVSNTVKTALELIRCYFGGVIYSNKLKPDREHICYQWRASSNAAKDILEQILPYLVLKRQQAELAIQFQTIISSRGKHLHTRRLRQSEVEYREAAYKLLQLMKAPELVNEQIQQTVMDKLSQGV